MPIMTVKQQESDWCVGGSVDQLTFELGYELQFELILM